jgi:hypothetical protein
MDPFSLLVGNLNSLGFFGFLFPWIFTFAIFYGLLTKTKLFDNAKVTGILSLVGGPFIASFFVNLFGYATIIIAGILVIVLFIAMSGGDAVKLLGDNKGVAAVLVGIGIVVFFVAMGGTVVFISDAVIGILFIIILMAVAVYFIAK